MPEEKSDDRGALDAVAETEFGDAFVQAEGVGNQPDLKKADDPANAAVEKPAEEKPLVEAAKPAEDVKPADETQPIKKDDEETWEQRYKTLQGIHKHDKQTWDDEKTTFVAQVEEAKKPKSPEKAEPTKEQKEAAEAFIGSLTDEQKKQLEEYEQDFDVVSKMEGLKRGVELGKLRKEFQEWKNEISGKLTEHESKLGPVIKAAAESEREAHFDLIRDGYRREDGTVAPGHADFEKYRDDGSLLKWIESKPRYMQPALLQTYKEGNAIDVIDLFSDFKRENNITEQPPSDKVVNIRKAEKKQALTAVDSRRTAVNTGYRSADDYEGAFDEALKK